MKINWEQLCEAVGDYSQSRIYIFNKKTGEIIIVSEYMSDSGKRDLKQQVAGIKPENCVVVPTMSSRDGFKLMEEFVPFVKDDKVKSLLAEILPQDAPFKRFKELVFKNPEIRKQWQNYRQEKLTEHAKKWLVKEGIKEE
jgi:hypothetical protein